jgi:hypothetical protein
MRNPHFGNKTIGVIVASENPGVNIGAAVGSNGVLIRRSHLSIQDSKVITFQFLDKTKSFSWLLP